METLAVVGLISLLIAAAGAVGTGKINKELSAIVVILMAAISFFFAMFIFDK